MDHERHHRIERSFNRLSPRAADLVDRFYSRLFAEHPEVRHLFPKEMQDQKKKLLASLALTVEGLREPEGLRDTLMEMGKRHVEYGTKPEHYPVVRDVLISVLAEMSGDAWSEQLSADWEAALDFVACTMLQGAKSLVGSSA